MKEKLIYFYTLLIVLFLLFLKIIISNSGKIDENSIQNKKVVVHVAREYEKLVLYGGLGSVLGSLTTYQSKSDFLEPWIVLPLYKFIEITNDEFFTEITVTYDDKKIQVPIYQKQFGGVKVFLIGEGDEYPFNQVFDTTLQKLYATPEGISSSLREGFFSVCTAKLIIKLWKGNFENHFDFQGKKIDFVHVHGSTNGLIVPLLHFSMGKTLRPSIIYTMHDYSSEPWSLIKKKDLELFSIQIPNEINFKSNVVSISPIGLSNSDAITCVSKTMREEIVNGVVYFAYRDLILKKKEIFSGVPNAVADEMQPFNHIQLKKEGFQFKEGESILNWKEKVKKYLWTKKVIPGISTDYDSFMNKPIVLFIGRFEMDKGIEFFSLVSSMTSSLQFNFIIMGYYPPNNNWAKDTISLLKGKENVFIIEEKSFQKKFGIFFRVIADFYFIPSKKEGFGLVAAESQSMGSIPISSNVGGLKDIIKSESLNSNNWNGFMFNIDQHEELTFFNIKNTFTRALKIFRELSKSEKEIRLKKIMDQSPKWSNSLKLYWNVYKNAEKRKSSLQPNFGSHSNFRKFFTENIAKNPSFENTNPSQEWLAFVSGFKFSKNGRSSNCIKMKNEHKNDKRGAFQEIFLQQKKPKSILISGWSKAQDVSGKMDKDYSIYVDIVFQSNQNVLGFHSSFDVESHPWQYKELWLHFDQPIKSIVLTLMFKHHTGIVYFDDIQVRELM
eukprot:gene4150-7460_t